MIETKIVHCIVNKSQGPNAVYKDCLKFCDGMNTVRSPLDPLLERLAKKYVNDEDLTTRLKTLYHVSIVIGQKLRSYD